MEANTPAPSPVSLSQAQAPRWFIRSDKVWASRRICEKESTRLQREYTVGRCLWTYLVRALAVDGHNEANAACLVLILRIVESLFARCLPGHLLLLLLLLLIFSLGLHLIQIEFIRLFVTATRRVIALKVIDIVFKVIGIVAAAAACCTFKFAIVSGYWCHYTLYTVALAETFLARFALLFRKLIQLFYFTFISYFHLNLLICWKLFLVSTENWVAVGQEEKEGEREEKNKWITIYLIRCTWDNSVFRILQLFICTQTHSLTYTHTNSHLHFYSACLNLFIFYTRNAYWGTRDTDGCSQANELRLWSAALSNPQQQQQQRSGRLLREWERERAECCQEQRSNRLRSPELSLSHFISLSLSVVTFRYCLPFRFYIESGVCNMKLLLHLHF